MRGWRNNERSGKFANILLPCSRLSIMMPPSCTQPGQLLWPYDRCLDLPHGDGLCLCLGASQGGALHCVHTGDLSSCQYQAFDESPNPSIKSKKPHFVPSKSHFAPSLAPTVFDLFAQRRYLAGHQFLRTQFLVHSRRPRQEMR
jgi:hypothetical protein